MAVDGIIVRDSFPKQQVEGNFSPLIDLFFIFNEEARYIAWMDPR